MGFDPLPPSFPPSLSATAFRSGHFDGVGRLFSPFPSLSITLSTVSSAFFGSSPSFVSFRSEESYEGDFRRSRFDGFGTLRRVEEGDGRRRETEVVGGFSKGEAEGPALVTVRERPKGEGGEGRERRECWHFEKGRRSFRSPLLWPVVLSILATNHFRKKELARTEAKIARVRANCGKAVDRKSFQLAVSEKRQSENEREVVNQLRFS